MKKIDFISTAFLVAMIFTVGNILLVAGRVADIMPLAMYVVMLILGVIVYVVSFAFANDLKGCSLGMVSVLLTWGGIYALGFHQGLAYGLFVCGTLLCFGYCGYLIFRKFLKRM